MDTALLASIAQQMMSNDTVDVRAPSHWGQRRMKFLLKEWQRRVTQTKRFSLSGKKIPPTWNR